MMGGAHPSPLKHLLLRFPQPFAHSNGIRVEARLRHLSKVASSHAEAKEMVQRKYFPNLVNPSIPIFSFVGRITKQKGVHLILSVMRDLINRYKERIQIIVGGPADRKDPYAERCAWQIVRSSLQKKKKKDPDNEQTKTIFDLWSLIFDL